MCYVASYLTHTDGCRELKRIGADEHEAFHRDGFLLLQGVFDEERLLTLRAGVDSLIARARAGECELRWIDADVFDSDGAMQELESVNGILVPGVGETSILGIIRFNVQSLDSYYWLTLALCAGGILLLRHAAHAPFGYALRAARDAPLRAEATGLATRRIQLAAFAGAGALAGLAGGLFVFSKGSVFPNELEARAITGQHTVEDMLASLHDSGVSLAVIKRGAEGAVISWDGNREDIPAAGVHAIDTCGAGDNFAGAFLAGWLKGLDPVECARLGCEMGTLCVQQKGAVTASSNAAKLEELIGRYGIG